MSKKVDRTRKDVLLMGSLYLIPIFIVSGVLSVDLYINVQRWRYDYLTIQAKRDIVRWVENKSEFIRPNKKSQEENKEKETTISIGKTENNSDREEKHNSILGNVIKKINRFASFEEQNQGEVQNSKKEEDIKFGLQAMMAEIETLKVEKKKLENLQNLTRLGYQLGLVSPKPEQVVRISYSNDEREKIVQTASLDILFPQKPKKMEITPGETGYAKKKKNIKQNIIDYLDNFLSTVQDKVFSEITTPVNADSKNNIEEQPGEDNFIRTNKERLNDDKKNNNLDLDIDLMTEFLLEKL